MSILKGLLQNEEFLIGAGLLQAGSMGQNIGQSIFPALTQAGKTQTLFANAESAQKKKDAFNKLLESDQVSDINKLYIAAGVTPPKKSQRRIVKDASGVSRYVDTGEKVIEGDQKPVKTDIGDETLRVYNLLKNSSDFDKTFEGLNQAEKDLYNMKIKGNESLIDAIMKQAVKDGKQSSIDFSIYNLTPDTIKQYGEKATVEQIFNAFKKSNPGVSDQKLLQALIDDGYIIGG